MHSEQRVCTVRDRWDIEIACLYVSRKENPCIFTEENDDIRIECLRKRDQIAGFGTKSGGQKPLLDPPLEKVGVN